MDKLDLLITNGRILDGTGNPAIDADIGVIGGEIAVMARDLSQGTKELTVQSL